MHAQPRRLVLVIGTGWASASKKRIARMLGMTLAEAGFGLISGNSRGIDYAVSEAYCAVRIAQQLPLHGAFYQITLGGMRFFRRGGVPLPGYPAPEACQMRVDNVEEWKRESIARCDAGVMVGGGSGALDIARRIIEHGKPVFPLPFMGGMTGNSDLVFREILKTWDGYPVPGVSRSQFLRLAEPWISGTGPLLNLLAGTLADAPDIFISYRRQDAPAAAGRIESDLAEHFGRRRVFLDVSGIAPSRAWDQTIDGALRGCKVGVVVIGRQWLLHGADGTLPRLHDPDDVVRAEIEYLLRNGKAVFPVLVEGALLPDEQTLPASLLPLLRFQAVSFDNAGWEAMMQRIIREIELVVHRDAVVLPQVNGDDKPESSD